MTNLFTIFSMNNWIHLIDRARELTQVFDDVDFITYDDLVDDNSTNNIGMVDSSYVIKVPFNQETESLVVRVEDDMLVIITKENSNGFKSESSTKVYIPSCFDKSSMVQSYDPNTKEMTFMFEQFETNNVCSSEEEPKLESKVSNNTEDKSQTSKDELIKKMIEMKEQGCSYRKIAKETGISDKTVKRWLKKYME